MLEERRANAFGNRENLLLNTLNGSSIITETNSVI
jgi:hypothetical protein